MDKLKIFMVYFVSLMLTTCLLKKAEAFSEYDVEWPTSDGKKQTSTIVITIDGCRTLITMKNSDIEAFSKSKSILKEATATAIKRAKNGCKD